jgi:Domain of unknown function (DUF222)
MPPAPSPDPDPDTPDPSQAPDPSQTPEPPWAGDEEEDSADYLAELMAAAAAGEELTTADIAGAGFGQDGTAHQMHPGPVLATLVHAATTDEKILATLSDDDLAGVIVAVRRIGSFAAWAELTAIREYATRPDPRRAAPATTCGGVPGATPGGRVRGVDSRDPNAGVAGLPRVREFAAEELAPDLHLSGQSAAGQIAYACTVAARLPVTFAALRAGQIHPVHLRIADDETAYLDEKYLAEADEKIAAAAQSKTWGNCGTTRTAWSSSSTRTPPCGARTRPARTRTCGRSGKPPATPGCPPANSLPMRSSRPGSTSTSGPGTCARPASPAPSKNSA